MHNCTAQSVDFVAITADVAFQLYVIDNAYKEIEFTDNPQHLDFFPKSKGIHDHIDATENPIVLNHAHADTVSDTPESQGCFVGSTQSKSS